MVVWEISVGGAGGGNSTNPAYVHVGIVPVHKNHADTEVTLIPENHVDTGIVLILENRIDVGIVQVCVCIWTGVQIPQRSDVPIT